MPLVAANGLGRTHGTTFRVLSLRGRYTAEADLQGGEKRDCNLVGFGQEQSLVPGQCASKLCLF